MLFWATSLPDQPSRLLLAQLSCIKNASEAPAVGPGLPAGALRCPLFALMIEFLQLPVDSVSFM